MAKITYVEIHRNFTDNCRIIIACTKMEIQIINQTPVFSSYSISPFLSDWVTVQ